MKKLIILSIAAAIAIFAADAGWARTPLMPLDPAGRPVYQEGVVTIKLRKDAKTSSRPKVQGRQSDARFGISSLDATLDELKAGGSVQRYPAPAGKLKMKPGIQSASLPDLSRYYRIRLPEGTDIFKAVRLLAKDPNVELAEPVPQNYAYAEPNDTRYSEQTHLPQILADMAWDLHKGEQNTANPVLIGICDSGVEWDHPDLLANLYQNLAEDADGDGHTIEFIDGKWQLDPGDLDGNDNDNNGYVDDLIGWNFSGDVDGTDANQPMASGSNIHGTHVAGLATAVTNNEEGVAGVAWNIRFMPTKHGSNSGGTSIYDGYSGIKYLAEMGADIINCSWGGSGGSQEEQDVIDYATALGSIVVVSAGNNNNDVMQYPSSYRHVLSVASVAKTDVRAYYSSYGISVDVASPGGDSHVDGGLLSTLPGREYGRLQGTSMASPVATGALALLKSRFHYWTNDHLIRQFLLSTDNIDSKNPDYAGKLGYGRINLFRALDDTVLTDVKPTLKLLTESYEYTDGDGDEAIEPGEEISFGLIISNYDALGKSDALKLTLSTDDPSVVITHPEMTVSVNADGKITTPRDFKVKILQNAKTHTIKFHVTASADDADISPLSNLDFETVVQNGGVFCWQPDKMMKNASSKYFCEMLCQYGITNAFTTSPIHSLKNFDAVVLSFGCYGYDGGYLNYGDFDDNTAALVTDYLKSGGKLYLEGGLLLGWYQYGNTELLNLLGIKEAFQGMGGLYDASFFPLTGTLDTWTKDMNFDGFDLYAIGYIDTVQANNTTGKKTFDLYNTYGGLSVMCTGDYGQKSFYSSVPLAALADKEGVSTKEELFYRVATHLEMGLPLRITLDDAETCKGSPVIIGSEYPVFGGSGSYNLHWTPAGGLDDAKVPNPTVLNPQYSRSLTLRVDDKRFPMTKSASMNLTVSTPPAIVMPAFRRWPFNTTIDLNTLVVSPAWPTEGLVYNWYNSAMEPIENPSEIVPPPGLNKYYLKLVNMNECESPAKSVSLFVSYRKGVADDDIAEGVNGSGILIAYPTPATDVLNVNAEFIRPSAAQVRLVSLIGKEIFSSTFESAQSLESTIRLDGVAPGIYLLIIETDDDVITKKVIKE